MIRWQAKGLQGIAHCLLGALKRACYETIICRIAQNLGQAFAHAFGLHMAGFVQRCIDLSLDPAGVIPCRLAMPQKVERREILDHLVTAISGASSAFIPTRLYPQST